MKIGLIDVDSHNFPNLPLMKISAYHKAQGDSVEWYSPMFSGHMDRVYASKIFGFTSDYEYHIDADEVIKGGSGYCIKLVDEKEIYDTTNDTALPDEIEHIYPDYDLYPNLTKDTAFGYLTRGCPRNCAFCHTTQKDGFRSVKVADLSEFWNGQKNIVLLDQNILACRDHLDLLDQLIQSGARVEFNGGLDARLLNQENIEKIQQIRIKTIHFAFDRYQDREVIENRLKTFMQISGYDHHKVMCYVLTNFDTDLRQDLIRIQICRDLDIQPYVMIYDKSNADPIYRKLQRWCNPFIFWRVRTFEQYLGGHNNG